MTEKKRNEEAAPPVETPPESVDSPGVTLPAPVSTAPAWSVVETPPVKPIDEDGKIFDFTLSTEAMGPKTKVAYYLLRRKAKLANRGKGDPELLPDGKKMKLAEIEAALGSTLEAAIVAAKCCGQ